ncbi:MAG: transcriptional repressor [Lachnospiraceae bacterium]|nr:transcriptional repressor [Lachnospiraceae bacterium]
MDRREMVLQRLKEQGCRITKQRRILLDIILEENCSCCKEIYYKASRIDSSIGAATVYRMVNLLEEAGAISRRNMYRVACDTENTCGGCETDCARDMKEACDLCRTGEACGACAAHGCTIELADHTVYHLSAGNWNRVIRAGLEACGYASDVRSVTIQPCGCE